MTRAKSISWQQGYDQGFCDAINHEENGFAIAVTNGERDWADGYYQGHTAGESSLLDDHGHRPGGAGWGGGT
jgi:hypothetical protein